MEYSIKPKKLILEFCNRIKTEKLVYILRLSLGIGR